MSGEWLIQPDNIIYNIRVSDCLSSEMTIQLRRGMMWCMLCTYLLVVSSHVEIFKLCYVRNTKVFLHSWHLFLVFVPDILASVENKFISFQKSNLLKLERRIVQKRDIKTTNILILWRLRAHQSPALFLRLHHIRSYQINPRHI